MAHEESINKLTQVLEDAGVELSDSAKSLIPEAFQKIVVVDKKPTLKDKLLPQVRLTVDRILDNNPELQPYASEIIDVFVGASKNENVKTALNNELKEVKEKYSQKVFSDVVQEITDLSTNKDFAEKVGPKNIKEFSERVEKLKDEYAKAPANAKGDNLLKNLGSLKQWADTKQKESKAPTFSKLATIISSYGKAVGALISGNSKAAAEHKMNASQAIKELTQGKKVSQALDSIGKKTKSWAEKITQEKAKGQSEQKSR